METNLDAFIRNVTDKRDEVQSITTSIDKKCFIESFTYIFTVWKLSWPFIPKVGFAFINFQVPFRYYLQLYNLRTKTGNEPYWILQHV